MNYFGYCSYVISVICTEGKESTKGKWRVVTSSKYHRNSFRQKRITRFIHLYCYSLIMLVDKLFWSKAKTDILKYLIFRRQWISMRAFETELQWSFPAIKKQIDQLEDAGIVHIWKNTSKRSIYLNEWVYFHLKELFRYVLREDLKKSFDSYNWLVDTFFLWKVFGKDFDMDLVLIYNADQLWNLDLLKKDITEIFRNFLIEYVNVVFLTVEEFDQRNRLADKFVLRLLRTVKPEK